MKLDEVIKHSTDEDRLKNDPLSSDVHVTGRASYMAAIDGLRQLEQLLSSDQTHQDEQLLQQVVMLRKMINTSLKNKIPPPATAPDMQTPAVGRAVGIAGRAS